MAVKGRVGWISVVPVVVMVGEFPHSEKSSASLFPDRESQSR